MNRVAIVWVKNYSAAGINHGPGASDRAAGGFADAIQVEPILNQSEGRANDALFQDGQGQAEVERAHLVYFSGFGQANGPRFADSAHNDGIARPDEMRLGSEGLAVVVFDCCSVLTDFEHWKEIFDGLHYMLGFRNIIQLSPLRGRYFAERLRSQNPRFSIAEAWIRASLATEASTWHVLRAVPENGTTEDATWSNDIPPQSGPRPPFDFISRTEVQVPRDSPLLASLGEEIRDKVPLFATPAPALSDARLADLAPKFGVSPAGQDPYGGWKASRTTGPFLEVAEASESIWFTGRRAPVRKVFDPPPGVPSIEEAIDAADAFLHDKNLQDDRLTPPTISITKETHEPRTGPPGTPWDAELHVNYTWSLAELPVFGPGARIRVTFRNPNLEVDEILRFWREPRQQQGLQNILTPEQAEIELRKEIPRVENLHWTLGYLALAPTVEQDFLLPVYRFVGTASSPGLTQDFVRDVQAVSKEDRSRFPPSSVFHLPPVL